MQGRALGTASGSAGVGGGVGNQSLGRKASPVRQRRFRGEKGALAQRLPGGSWGGNALLGCSGGGLVGRSPPTVRRASSTQPPRPSPPPEQPRGQKAAEAGRDIPGNIRLEERRSACWGRESPLSVGLREPQDTQRLSPAGAGRAREKPASGAGGTSPGHWHPVATTAKRHCQTLPSVGSWPQQGSPSLHICKSAGTVFLHMVCN